MQQISTIFINTCWSVKSPRQSVHFSVFQPVRVSSLPENQARKIRDSKQLNFNRGKTYFAVTDLVKYSLPKAKYPFWTVKNGIFIWILILLTVLKLSHSRKLHKMMEGWKLGRRHITACHSSITGRSRSTMTRPDGPSFSPSRPWRIINPKPLIQQEKQTVQSSNDSHSTLLAAISYLDET